GNSRMINASSPGVRRVVRFSVLIGGDKLGDAFVREWRGRICGRIANTERYDGHERAQATQSRRPGVAEHAAIPKTRTDRTQHLSGGREWGHDSRDSAVCCDAHPQMEMRLAPLAAMHDDPPR